MDRAKLYQLYQTVQNPFKMLDQMLFSQPVIEKCSTFELKFLYFSYGISVGVYFDERANKKTRKFFMAGNIVCTLAIWVCCLIFLSDLLTYDLETVTMALIPIIITTTKVIFMIVSNYVYDVLVQLLEFFAKDSENSNCSEYSEETNGNDIGLKKWIIFVSSFFCGAYVCANLVFDLNNEARTKFTSRPYVMKFFPIWCPFESYWVKKAMSFFQGVIVLPELMIFYFGCFMLFISIVEMQKKFADLYGKLKLISDRTFERIGIFDKQLEDAMQISSKRTRSCIIKGLDVERMNTIAAFHRDFVACVKRFQNLQRAQMLWKTILDLCCSVTYCFILSIMIAFVFVGMEALSNTDHGLQSIIKMVIWIPVFGIVWYMMCFIGELFSQQNDLFAEEVYSMPWYHFTPKQRKTVLILLATIQKPTYLRALKLVKVKMDTFPEFLNSVYSYVQIMRTLQNVKYHRKI